MKKIVTASLFMLFLAVFAANISYSAFPILSKPATTTVASQDEPPTTPAQQQVNASKEATAAAPAAPAPASSGKSQIIALILVLLVGGLGIHRFYLGYTWQGVVQLLTLGGCGIWALIDLIRIVTGDLQPKNGSYDQTL
ncbi:MAG: TM2 domain-containing protein [Sphingobacteriales bacterium]|nr:MAG: TM2 domain-containing protein [Sphingobacteriales bacterium]